MFSGISSVEMGTEGLRKVPGALLCGPAVRACMWCPRLALHDPRQAASSSGVEVPTRADRP